MTTATAPGRRSQAERREQTRSALIAATIRAISQEGYQATTTRRVAELADSSLGALAHHFPSRLDLIAASLDEVGKRAVDDLGALAADLPAEGRDRVCAVLDAIWTYFNGELFVVWLRVWVAAAEDPELYRRLVPLQPELSRAIGAATAELWPADVARKEWTIRLNVALDTMRGLAFRRTVEPGAQKDQEAWPRTRAELLRLLMD